MSEYYGMYEDELSKHLESYKGKNPQESSVEPYEYYEWLGSVSSNKVENIKEDLVKKPNHYQLLPEYEVKHVIKALLDKIDASDFEMSSYQCGWLQQSLQYQLRFYAKNGLEDLEKAYETLGFVIEDMKRKD